MDDLEVLRRIRQTAPTPILMLTARGEETDRVIGLEGEGSCFTIRLPAATASTITTQSLLPHTLLS